MSLFRWPVILCVALFLGSVAFGVAEPSWNLLWIFFAALLAVVLIPVFFRKPTHDRVWEPYWRHLATARTEGRRITIENFRDFKWTGLGQYDERWTERRFDLDDLDRLDLMISPFGPKPLGIAHVMLGFRFGNEDDWLLVSPEARREKGEKYGVFKGAFRQFELAYVVGSPEDLVLERAAIRQAEVYSYPIAATPEFRQNLLLALLDTVNEVAAEPVFYDSFRRNCTTLLVDHIDRLRPDEAPVGLRIGTLFPARAGHLLHGYGYMDTDRTYEQAKEHFRIDVAWRNRFSRERGESAIASQSCEAGTLSR